MGTKEICKYYLHGACRNGAGCRFSHSMDAPKSTVCAYYLAGNCAYGDKCRYDHVRPPKESAGAPPPPPGPPPQAASRGAGRGAGFMSASASSFNPNASAFNPLEGAMNRMHLGGGGVVGGGGGGVVGGGLYAPPLPPSAPAWGGAGYHHQQPVVGDGGGEGDEDWGYEDEQGNWISFNEGGGDEVEFLKSQLPDEDDLLDGLGAEPPQQHGGGGGGADDEWGYYDDAGQWISFGGEVDQYLQAAQPHEYQAAPHAPPPPPQHHAYQHPPPGGPPLRRPDAFAAHAPGGAPSAEEERRTREDEARAAASAEVECGICLEVVHEKPRIGDRRFGLLSGCDHAFCLACIRDWRDGGVAGKDAATASALDQARKCPICRAQSHYTVPSTYWPRDEIDKAMIVGEYKRRMDKIPCRNFDYGDGHCPFGSSCFYAHLLRDGSRASEDVRKTTDAEGNLNIVGGIRLSDFLDTSAGRRALR